MQSPSSTTISMNNKTEQQYLHQLECTVLHASNTGSQESSHSLDIERQKSHDGLASVCLELLRRRGWGRRAAVSCCNAASCDANTTTTTNDCNGQQHHHQLQQQHQQYDAVAFYALTTIQRSPILSCIPSTATTTTATNNFASIRNELRSLLLTTISHPINIVQTSMPSFVMTKIAILLALLVREEYPNLGWSCPLNDVRIALNLIESTEDYSTPLNNNMNVNVNANGSVGYYYTSDKMASVGIYISFLDAISDEIVYPSIAIGDADVDADNNGGIPTTAAATRRTNTNHNYQRVRREQVKDALRGFSTNELLSGNASGNNTESSPQLPMMALEQTDTANIVGWLLHVVSTVTTQVSQSQQLENDMMVLLSLAVRAVATLKRYLSWIDIRLATNSKLVQMLLNGLGGASHSSSSSSSSDDDEEGEDEPTQWTMLAVECANCLSEIVDRGMDEGKKLVLLSDLDIFGTLCYLSQIQVSSNGSSRSSSINGCQGGGRSGGGGKLDLINADGTHIEAVAAAAELINVAGLALIQGWDLIIDEPTTVQQSSSSTSTNVQMEQCLELVLTCLAYDSIDVSGAVVDVVSRILVSLEKKDEYWNNAFFGASSTNDTACNKILSRILLILHLRMRYPTDFRYDYEDEEEAEEELYRAHLRKLYQRIVRLRPQLALEFIGQCLSSLPQPLSSSPTPEIEVALRFVYHYGEGRRPAPGAKTALKDVQFREIIVALHRSDVSSHPHREVLLLYYDISVRYVSILKETPELLTLLLGSLSGNRGLQHSYTRLRCRCCYLLLRLIKSVGAKAMRPHVEAVVDGIQMLLFPSDPQLQMIPPNEALYLFEATGILLGTTGLDDDMQVRCIEAVLTPHIQNIQRTLQNPDLARDVETYGEQLSLSLSAISQLSKGWQKHPPTGVQTVLAAAVDICRNVLAALPSSPLVRSRTAVLLQRMILCLGEGILPVMPSFFSLLLSHCALEEDVLDISQLMNQLCIKFKENAATALDAPLLPFLQHVLAIQIGTSGMDNGGSDNGISPPPHMITEQLSVRKQAFATLQHIVIHNVSIVLYSETNVNSLGDILQLMNDGAISVPDPVMNKTCAQFFCELISQWGRDHSTQHVVSNAFFDFVYGTFVPGIICRSLDRTFNVKDALYCRVLAEFSRALWLLKQSYRGNSEFHSRVIDMLVISGDASGRKGSQKIANGFQNAMSGKDIEMTLKAWKDELMQQ